MRLRHSYCLAPEYIKPHECDRIVEICGKLPINTAGMAKGTDPDGTKRRSDIAWLADNPAHIWIYERVNLCVATANKQYWHWQMAGHEPLQYTTYGPGQYYQWHTDASSSPYGKSSLWPGMIRKISVTVQLSHPDDYKGGDFLLENPRVSPDRADERLLTLGNARKRGTVMMFPSHLFHRVSEVTGGMRRSLVGWYLGPPFK